MTYIALLRGINVGGRTIVKMEELKQAFEKLGCNQVKTALASGNVIFETKESNVTALAQKIEDWLKETFGFKIVVILITSHALQAFVKAHPFKHIKVTPQTRLLVTFLRYAPKSSIKIPYQSPEKDFKILHIFGHVIFSIVQLSSTTGTTDLMKLLEKEFGKNITTRTWNTIIKIEKMLSSN